MSQIIIPREELTRRREEWLAAKQAREEEAKRRGAKDYQDYIHRIFAKKAKGQLRRSKRR